MLAVEFNPDVISTSAPLSSSSLHVITLLRAFFLVTFMSKKLRMMLNTKEMNERHKRIECTRSNYAMSSFLKSTRPSSLFKILLIDREPRNRPALQELSMMP